MLESAEQQPSPLRREPHTLSYGQSPETLELREPVDDLIWVHRDLVPARPERIAEEPVRFGGVGHEVVG